MKEKVQSSRRHRLFGLFATITMALGVGISLSTKSPLQTKAAAYSYSFNEKIFDANNQTKKLTGINWTLVNNGDYYGYDATKGQQVGSGNKPAASMTLTTSEIVGTITAVKISTSGAKDVSATVLASVGGVDYGTAKSISATNTEYEFDGNSAGEIALKWEQSSSKALYFKKIEVVYTTKTLQSIAVTTPPTKLHYVAGETFDKTGMVVTATYDTGDPEVINNNDVTIEPSVMSEGLSEVVASYQGQSFTITGVSVEAAPTVNSLVVTGDAVKTNYYAGDVFDPSGLTVTANLSNGTTKDVTELASYTPNPLTAGTTEVLISYGDETATYGPIEVIVQTSKTITITKESLDLTTTASERTHSFDGVGFTSKVRDQQGAILFDKGVGYLYNTTSLGNISNIKLNYSSSGSAAAVQYFNFGDSVIAGFKNSGTTTISTSPKDGSYDVEVASSAGFFNLSVSSANALQLSSLEITYSVEAVDLEGITIDKSTFELFKDETTTLGVIFNPVNATNKKVNWESSDATKVSVDATGTSVTVTALAATGETPVTITATAEDGGFSATSQVTVKLIHVTSVTLSKETTSLVEGTSEQLVVSLLPENAHNKDLTWESSDSTYVSVSASGLITGLKPTVSPVIITVTSVDSGDFDTISVTVTEYTAQTGTYTITSNTTTYTQNPTINNLKVIKSNESQGAIVLSDLNDFRLGGSPNTTYMMLGPGSSGGGQVSFTMPSDVYVTSIKLKEVLANDGDLTLSVNASSAINVTSSVNGNDLTFTPYTNKVTLNSTKRLWIKSIVIETKTAADAALDYANLFLNKTGVECSTLNVLSATWNELADIYTGMDSAIRAQFVDVVGVDGGTPLEEMVLRYTFIQNKYKYVGFMNLGVEEVNQPIEIKSNNQVLSLVVLGSVILIAAVIFFYVMKNKQEFFG